MENFQVNYLAVHFSGVVMFALGGLWYSPALYAKKWTALMGTTEANIPTASKKSMRVQYLIVFICGLITSWAIAVADNHVQNLSVPCGVIIGAFCWVFAAATSFGTALFSMRPLQVWLINSSYNLVSFVIAGAILAVWR
jgi:hypothetical protein